VLLILNVFVELLLLLWVLFFHFVVGVEIKSRMKAERPNKKTTKEKAQATRSAAAQIIHIAFTSHSHRKNKRKESHLLKCFFIVCLFIIVVVGDKRTQTDAFAAPCYLFCFSHLIFPLCFVYFL